jgi:hypothetical protein
MNKTCNFWPFELWLSLVQHDLQFHPFSWKWYNLIFLCAWVILHGVYMPFSLFNKVLDTLSFPHLVLWTELHKCGNAGILYIDLYSFRYMPRHGLAGSYFWSIFSFFLRKLHTDFYGGCSSLPSQQQCIRVLSAPPAQQHLSSWW